MHTKSMDEEEVKDDKEIALDDDAFEEVEVGLGADDIDMSSEFNTDEDVESDFVTDEERDGMY